MQIFVCVSFALYYHISEMSTNDLCRFEQFLCLATRNILRLICQTYHFFFAPFGVFYRLICPSSSALNIAYHKIRTANLFMHLLTNSLFWCIMYLYQILIQQEVNCYGYKILFCHSYTDTDLRISKSPHFRANCRERRY